MSHYTQDQLAQRNKIIQSQKQLWLLLDSDIINKLVYLFDKRIISNYIIDEREIQGLDSLDIEVSSKVYGFEENNPSLHLQIKKNGKDYLHLSIHLVVSKLKAKNTGVIHFFKNKYKNKNIYPTISKKTLYALIAVHQPVNKPHSLEFSIADGYTTPGIQNAYLYEPDIQKEMDVIITVLNRLFDEDNKEYYIGDQSNLVAIQNHTNTVLEHMNKYTQHVSRLNKGTRMLPPSTNKIVFNAKSKIVQKTLKQPQYNKSKRTQTRKTTLRNPSRSNTPPKTARSIPLPAH